jgi:hypothetical protein
MDRRAFDLINSITVVPGAIGAFRKSAIFKGRGLYIRYPGRRLRPNYAHIQGKAILLKNCAEAIAYTEAPETLLTCC